MTTKDLLDRISQGGNVGEIAKELGMNKSTLRARIEFLVSRGYLEDNVLEVGICEGCSGCRGCRRDPSCVIPDDPSKGKIYTLTEKGLNEIRDSD